MAGREPPDETAVHRCAVTGAEVYTGSWRRESSPEHFHPQWQVTVGLAGAGAVRHLGRERVVGPGQPFVFRPGEPHALAPRRRTRWRFVSVYLPAEHVEAARRRRRPDGETTPALLAEALLAVAEAVRVGRGSARAVNLLAVRLAAWPAPSDGRDAARDARVEAARDHLLAHLDRRVPVAELARAVGAAPGPLARAFKAAVGLSPHAFHLQARIHRAKALLDRGAPLAEVAVCAGFVDQAHFTRHFARLQRTSPGRWRGGGGNVQDRRRRAG